MVMSMHTGPLVLLLVKKAIPYPCFDPQTFEGDLQLLQVNMFFFFFNNNFEIAKV